MKEDLQSIKQRFHIIGHSPLLNRAIEIAMQVASTELSVLITGESGSGKESFSKLIHELSPYRHSPFIALNCGAIPEGTIDSELFGHEKGAFTGAIETRKGYFEQANGGTIFLDEIGEMPLATQAKLLRVLEYGEYVKVGSSKVEKTKVRIVAATNVDLLNAIKEKKFREDLYFRLNTVPILIPPLRQRGTDITLLFNKFSCDFAMKYRVKPLELTPAAKDKLEAYGFPGNIRQLKNIVEQMALLEKDVLIHEETLCQYLPPEQSHMLPVLYKQEKHGAPYQQDSLYAMLYDLKKDVTELKRLLFDLLRPNFVKYAVEEEANHQPIGLTKQGDDLTKKEPFEANSINCLEPSIENLSIETKEQELICKSLQKNHGNRKHAASDLGISERTLYRKIKKYAINENNFKD